MTLMLAFGAVLLAAPLAGQDADDDRAPAPAWFAPRAPVADPRLAPPITSPNASTANREAEVRVRPSFPALMLIGAVAGCAAGAVILSSGDDVGNREKGPVRFNGCLVGAPVGMIAGAVYGWASGTRMP